MPTTDPPSPEHAAPARRRGVRAVVAAHPLVSATLGVTVAAAIVVTLVVFQPQKLYINTTVDEALPLVGTAAAQAPPSSAASGGRATTATPAGPRTLASGRFHGVEHPSSGRALVIALPNGSRVLRLEQFRTSNGPDVHVYLAEGSGDPDRATFTRQAAELGGLKGNIGNQNYALPAGLDVARFHSAVVWCRRFSVAFAVAPLG